MSEKLTSVSQQTMLEEPSPLDHPMVGFFAIGVAINLILIGAYMIWVYRQWSKSKKKDE